MFYLIRRIGSQNLQIERCGGKVVPRDYKRTSEWLKKYWIGKTLIYQDYIGFFDILDSKYFSGWNMLKESLMNENKTKCMKEEWKELECIIGNIPWDSRLFAEIKAPPPPPSTN